MKWCSGDEQNAAVIKYDGWLDLPFGGASGKPGVFVLVSEKLEVQYIGIALQNLNAEIESCLKDIASNEPLYYSWYETAAESDAKNLYIKWKNKYNVE